MTNNNFWFVPGNNNNNNNAAVEMQAISASNKPASVQKKAQTAACLKALFEQTDPAFPMVDVVKPDGCWVDPQSLIKELNSSGRQEVLDFLLKGVLHSLHKWNLSSSFTRRTVMSKSQIASLRRWLECLFFRLDLNASTFFVALQLIDRLRKSTTWTQHTHRKRPTFELIFVVALVLASKINEDSVMNRTNHQWVQKLRNTFMYFRNMHHMEYALCMKIQPQRAGLNLKAVFNKLSLPLLSDTELVFLKCLEWRLSVSTADMMSFLMDTARGGPKVNGKAIIT